MNFKERFLEGDCSIAVIHDWAELWRTGVPNGKTLQEFLGLSDEEYQAWRTGGDFVLEERISRLSAPWYLTFYLTWDELGSQLEDLVKELLGMDCEVTIKRVDYYYWELQLDIPFDVDEDMSARICERLNLQGIDSDYFVDNDSICNDQLCALLGRLTKYDVTSSHADDDGVWVICKEYRTYSPDYAMDMIAQYDKQLRKELRSESCPELNRETARHQLVGFKAALNLLEMIPDAQQAVEPDHFSDCESVRDSTKAASTDD